MKGTTDSKSLTVRLRPDLYRSSVEIAKSRNMSMNAFIQESLLALIEGQEEERLYNDFILIAEDAAECNVEYALEAQREVVLHDG